MVKEGPAPGERDAVSGINAMERKVLGENEDDERDVVTERVLFQPLFVSILVEYTRDSDPSGD